jgi:hypothetical protein
MAVIGDRFARCLRLSLPALALGLAASAASAAEVSFELRIERGQVPAAMRRIRVGQGDVVRLRWTSDRPLALHLHGYDIETKVEPGKAAVMSFTARATGRFSVEEHRPQGSGGHAHGAPLVRIEVYPR